jgi:hypothetical protein
VLNAILPHSRRGRVLAAGALLDSAAMGLYLAVAVLYFADYVGITVAAIGGAIGLANLCGLLSPMPMARLSRRVGVLPVYLALLIVRGAGFIGYTQVNEYVGYVVVTCVMTAASRAATPLLQVVVAQLEAGEDRTRTMASLRVVNNIGLTGGFVAAGSAQLLHSRAAFTMLFFANGLAFAVVAALTLIAARPAAGATAAAERGDAGAPADGTRAGSVYRDRHYLTVAAANAVLLLHDSILFILMPLWVVHRCGLAPSVSTALMFLNTILTVLLQVYVSRFAKGVLASLRLLGVATAALGAGCLLLNSAGPGRPFVAMVYLGSAIALLTVGENLHAVAGWELSFVLSDPANRTQYLSLYSLGVTAQMIFGPVLMTSVVITWGGGLILVIGLFVVAALITMITVRVSPRAALVMRDDRQEVPV